MAKHGRQRDPASPRLRRTDRRRQERWQGILRQQADSGVSVRQFCREHQLAESSFYFWRRELGRRGREEGPAAAFVPVEVTPEAPARAAGKIEIALPGGWRVRLDGTVDRTVLADVLAAVAEAGMAVATEGGSSFAQASEDRGC